MNIADIVILLILGFAGYRGYQRGFIVSLLAIIAFILAIILAFVFLDWGVQMLDDVVDGFNGVLPYMAFVLIFIGVAVLINIVGKVLKKAIDLSLLGSVDNVAGAAVGVLKWVFGISLLLWLSQNVGIEIPTNTKESSLLYSRIEPVAPFIIDNVSEYLPFLKSLFHSIGERLRPDIQ